MEQFVLSKDPAFPRNIPQFYEKIKRCCQSNQFLEVVEHIYFLHTAPLYSPEMKALCDLIIKTQQLPLDYTGSAIINPLIKAQALTWVALHKLNTNSTLVENTFESHSLSFNDPTENTQLEMNLAPTNWSQTDRSGSIHLLERWNDRITLPPYSYSIALTAITDVSKLRYDDKALEGDHNERTALQLVKVAYEYAMAAHQQFLFLINSEIEQLSNSNSHRMNNHIQVIHWRFLLHPVLTIGRMVSRLYDGLSAIQEVALEFSASPQGFDRRVAKDATINLDYTLIPQQSRFNKTSYLRQFSEQRDLLTHFTADRHRSFTSPKSNGPGGSVVHIAENSLQLLVLGALSNVLLASFSSNNPTYNQFVQQLQSFTTTNTANNSPTILSPFNSANMMQLNTTPLSRAPFCKLDYVLYYYTLAYNDVRSGPSNFYRANIHLSKAYYLLITLTAPVHDKIANQIQSNLSVNNLRSVELTPREMSFIKLERTIVKMLCPLRLYGGGNPPGDVWAAFSKDRLGMQDELLVYSGLFSPHHLTSHLQLPLLGALTSAVVNGDVYMYQYLEQKYRNYWIKSGLYPIITALEHIVWLRLIVLTKLKIVPKLHQKYDHVVYLKDLDHINTRQYERFIETPFFAASLSLGVAGQMNHAIPGRNAKMLERQSTPGTVTIPPQAYHHSIPDSRVVIVKYRLTEIEAIIQNLISAHRIRGYLKPNSAIVLKKADPFPSSWPLNSTTSRPKNEHLQDVLKIWERKK